MAWIYLAAAAVLECIWPIAMKESDGFTRVIPGVITVVVAVVSLGLLSVAMRHIAVGTAYAAWTGIGAAGVAILGIVFYQEPATAFRIACIAAIVAGVIGLRVASGS